jgi:hypothetical protein
MNKSTFKVIITLVSLLFLNIEAAQAGLVTKLRMFIRAEFPEYQLLYITCGVLAASFLCYVIFSPVPGNERHRSVYSRFSGSSSQRFSHRKAAVERIAAALKRQTGHTKIAAPLEHVKRAA